MRAIALPVILAGLLFVKTSAAADAIDLLTFSCLHSVDNDPNVAVCSGLYPNLKAQVIEARAKYERRNAEDLKALRAACAARLDRAYGGNSASIAVARAEARRAQDTMNKELLSDPQASNRIDCRRYVEDYSNGNDRTDNLKDIIRAIRETDARPFEWKQ